MTIEDVMKTFERYGYSVVKEMMPDLAWGVEQMFNKVENPTNKEELAVRFTWPREYIGDNSKNFTIFEQEKVRHNGKMYSEVGRKYYFYSFDFEINENIYKDNEMDILVNSIHKEVISRMGTKDLRNIKLINIGI